MIPLVLKANSTSQLLAVANCSSSPYRCSNASASRNDMRMSAMVSPGWTMMDTSAHVCGVGHMVPSAMCGMGWMFMALPMSVMPARAIGPMAEKSINLLIDAPCKVAVMRPLKEASIIANLSKWIHDAIVLVAAQRVAAESRRGRCATTPALCLSWYCLRVNRAKNTAKQKINKSSRIAKSPRRDQKIVSTVDSFWLNRSLNDQKLGCKTDYSRSTYRGSERPVLAINSQQYGVS